MNGTQLAACCSYGSVTAWSYPRGEILFQSVLFQREVQEWMDEIKWNPFRQDVFATRHHGVKNAVNSLFRPIFPHFPNLFVWRREKGFNSFNYSINFSLFFYFAFFQVCNKLCLWNTRANGDATKANLFHTLERNIGIKIEWISANRIALGLDNGRGIEIWQIDEEGEATNSQVIQQFKHDVSLVISTILKLCYHFAYLLVKYWITGLKWNEKTKYLASHSSWDGWITV